MLRIFDANLLATFITHIELTVRGLEAVRVTKNRFPVNEVQIFLPLFRSTNFLKFQKQLFFPICCNFFNQRINNLNKPKNLEV